MESLGRDLKNVRKYFGSGKTKEASWRESQLKGLHSFLVEREQEILNALKRDLGKHCVEAFRDEVVFHVNQNQNHESRIMNHES